MRTLVLCLVVVMVCGLPIQRNHVYDHFVFTQEYPPGVCYNASSCSYHRNSSFWTIHGLWPSFGTTKGPKHCTNDRFNPTAIESILPLLEANWTNLRTDERHRGYWFWKHEYTTHGTCTCMNEKDFFTMVLNLFEQIQPYGNALDNAGIYPGNNRIEVSKIRAALQKHYGVKPILQCKEDTIPVLRQVQLCLNITYKPIMCPQYKEDSCGNKTLVIYPKSKYPN